MSAPPFSYFAPLPLRERLFVRAREFSAPLRAVAERAPNGRVADVGCGHGLMVALLQHAQRSVVGIDPDPRKIAWAQASSLGALSNVRFEVGTVQDLAARERESFDGVVVCDVLYLLPRPDWRGFLVACAALLKPGGVLLLKEAEADRSWRYWKCLAQERVMVEVLRRTQSSGGLGFISRGEMEQELTAAGFAEVRTEGLAKGYTTPHVLFTARRR